MRKENAMTAQQLAAGYDAYVSAEEVARAATAPRNAAVVEPTTSVLTPLCPIDSPNSET
jgi:hypothetical protein